MIEIKTRECNYIIPIDYIEYLKDYYDTGYGELQYFVFTKIGCIEVSEKEYSKIKNIILKDCDKE